MMAQAKISRWMVRHSNMARAVIIAAVSAITLLTLTLPFWQSAREMSQQIATKKTESQELADKVSVLSGLDEQELDQRVKILDRALPPKKDVVLYLSAIDGLSRELNLNFGGIKLAPGDVSEASSSAKVTKPSTKLAGLQTLETDIDITGSQESIYAFLRSIEESVPLMAVTDVKVSGVSPETYMLSLKLAMLYAVTDVKQIKGPITLFDQKEEEYFQKLDGYRKFEPLANIATQDTTLGKNNLFESFKPQQ